MLGSEEKRRIICGESFGLDEARRRRVVVGGREASSGIWKRICCVRRVADIGRIVGV